MHQTRRVSRSITRAASGKYRGSAAYAPLTTPAPRPRSHAANDTCFGPRGFVHISSPRASHNSAGLPSWSASRYLAISSVVDSASALPMKAASAVAAIPVANVRSIIFRILGSGNRRLVGPGVAMIVDPRDPHLVAFRAAREFERQERIFRHGRSPLRREHHLVGVRNLDRLDEPGRD